MMNNNKCNYLSLLFFNGIYGNKFMQVFNQHPSKHPQSLIPKVILLCKNPQPKSLKKHAYVWHVFCSNKLNSMFTHEK